MKAIIASTIVALSLVAGIAGSANAATDFNASTFFEELQRNGE